MYKKFTNNLGNLPPYTIKFFFIMKVIAIILLTTMLQAKALTILAQKITIKENNVSLMSVLKKIGTQSGYDIVYNRDLLADYKLVEVNLKAVTVAEALNSTLANFPLIFTNDDRMIMIRRKEQVSIPCLYVAVRLPAGPDCFAPCHRYSAIARGAADSFRGWR